MKYSYHKLVRDKIVENIEAKGSICKYRILEEKEYSQELDRKLLEEANEFIENHNIEEMADLLEVIESIQKNEKMNESRLKEIKEQKAIKKGSFAKKIFLEDVIEEDTNIERQISQKEKQKSLWEALEVRNSLKEVQAYIKNVNSIRGFESQPVQDTMLLLTEEIGELAKAIRKNATNMKIDENKINHYDSIESEVADCFYVLTSVCNKLNIDLFTCLKEKEKQNIERKWN